MFIALDMVRWCYIMDLETLVMLLKAEKERSRIVLDEKLGWVFYPCKNAIDETLEKSMA